MSEPAVAGDYEFLDDIAIADIAFRARGADLAALIASAARATVATMVEEFDTIRPSQSRPVELQAGDAGLLLFDFLQELIYYKDAERLVLLPAGVTIDTGDDGYHLRAELRGEPIDPARHPVNADVKAVTMHRFEVLEKEDGWEAMVVLDV